MDIRSQALETTSLPTQDRVVATSGSAAAASPATAEPGASADALDADRLALSARVSAAPAPVPSLDDRRGFFSEMLEKLADAVGDVVVAFGHVPLLGKLGYALYGAATRPRPDAPLSNQGTLSESVMRGAQPSDAGYAALKRAGVDTVINLRPEAPWADAMAEKQGLRAIDLPLPAIGAPTPAQAMAFLKFATDPANGRVYFNCQRGIDRTGAMAAAYRIAAQGWSVDQAAAEMRRFGFKEGVESDKLEFLRQFAAEWAALPEATRDETLHRA